jgi:hypothetical protein
MDYECSLGAACPHEQRKIESKLLADEHLKALVNDPAFQERLRESERLLVMLEEGGPEADAFKADASRQTRSLEILAVYTAQLKAYREALGLARSMLISGERMSERAEDIFDAAFNFRQEV